MADADAGKLRFDQPSTGAGAGVTCGACGDAIASAYYTVGDRVVCDRCARQLESSLARGARVRDGLKAVGMGSLWGLLGAAVWWGVRVFAQLEIGLIAIAIGYFVGKAVFTASGQRGGRAFQLLAVVLTYFWICANYMPDVLQGLWQTFDAPIAATEAGELEAGDGPGALAAADAIESEAPADASQRFGPMAVILTAILVVGIALAAPFLEGVQNAIGLMIIAFGLWEAWRLNQRRTLAIAGPFSVSASGESAARV